MPRFPATSPRHPPPPPPRAAQVKRPGGGFVSPFTKYMGPGILMIIVFALLIPGFWFWAVYANRRRLEVRG